MNINEIKTETRNRKHLAVDTDILGFSPNFRGKLL